MIEEFDVSGRVDPGDLFLDPGPHASSLPGANLPLPGEYQLFLGKNLSSSSGLGFLVRRLTMIRAPMETMTAG